MFKEFSKTFLAATVTVILLFGGLSAYAIYSDNTTSTEVQDVKPSYIATYNNDGSLKEVKREIPTKDTSILNSGQEITLTDEQFKATQEKGLAKFKVDNGKLVEKTTPDPKNKYVATYDQEGNVTGTQPNDGTATGNTVEIADDEYSKIQQGKKMKVVNGKMAEVIEDTAVTISGEGALPHN